MNLEEARAGVASVAAQIRLEEALRSAKVGDAFRTAGGWKASVVGVANESYRSPDERGLFLSGPPGVVEGHPHQCSTPPSKTFYVGFDGRNSCWYPPGNYHCHSTGAQFDVVAPWPGPRDLPDGYADTGEFRVPGDGEFGLTGGWENVSLESREAFSCSPAPSMLDGGKRHILRKNSFLDGAVVPTRDWVVPTQIQLEGPSKFKVGDRVRVKKNARELTEKKFGWVPAMDQMVEREWEVCYIHGASINVSGFNFVHEALELVSPEKAHAPKEECPGCGAYWDIDLGNGEPGCRHADACPYWEAYKSARYGHIPAKRYRTCKEYADAHWREHVAPAPWIPKAGDLVRVRKDAKQIALADIAEQKTGYNWHHEMDELQGREFRIVGIKKNEPPKRDVIYLEIGWAWWIDLLEPVVSKSTGAATGADRQGQSRASGRQTSAPLVKAQHPEREPQPEQGKNLPASVIWYCDCGFRGAKNDLNSDPSGCLWCPRCGGSGGLIAPPPPVSTDDPWTGAKEPFFSTMPKEERPQATLHARLQEEPEPKCAACDGKGKFFYIFHSVPGETRKIQAAMSSPCPECGRCVGGGG